MPKGQKAPACQPKKGRDFRVETYFVGGKMKKRKIPLIEGQAVEDFIRQNADDAFLVQEGYFEILHERETERNRANQSLQRTPGKVPSSSTEPEARRR